MARSDCKEHTERTVTGPPHFLISPASSPPRSGRGVQGRLAAEAEAHQRNCAERDRFIRQVAAEAGLPAPESEWCSAPATQCACGGGGHNRAVAGLRRGECGTAGECHCSGAAWVS